MLIFSIVKTILINNSSIVTAINNTDNYQDALKLYQTYNREIQHLIPNAIKIENEIPQPYQNNTDQYERLTVYKPNFKATQTTALVNLYCRQLKPSKINN